MEMVECKVTGFIIHFDDNAGQRVKLEIRHSDYAEQILRGLVHSGFMVTIQETEITVMLPKHNEGNAKWDVAGVTPITRGY